MPPSTHTRHGLTHACDGTFLEDGTAIAWRLCDGRRVAAAALSRARPVDCPVCRRLEDGARIPSFPVLAAGPPDLIASSWPGPRRTGTK